MKIKSLLLLVGFVLGCAAGALIWQRFAGAKLSAENHELRAEAARVAQLTEENAQLKSERVDPAELKRLRDGQTELIRLRGQTGQLRREAEEAKAAAARSQAAAQLAAASATAVTPPAQTIESPTMTYTAAATVKVGWRTAAATGGWSLPSGKRGFVLLMPSDPGDGTVRLRALVVQVPEILLASAGLDGLKTDGNAGEGGGALTPEQLQVLQSSFRKKEGVEIISAPAITVANGQQAQITTSDPAVTIDVVPTITPDKQGVEVVVGAQVNLPRTQ